MFPSTSPLAPSPKPGGTAPAKRALARTLHLPNVSVPALDEPNAKAAGILCGQRGTNDPIDASVVLNARRRHHTVITSDPADLRQLDPQLPIVAL